MSKSVVFALVLAASAAARAQENDVGNTHGANTDRENAQNDRQAAAGGTSDLFDRACIDMLHGNMPRDEQAIRALKDACSKLMSGRADERLQQEQQRKAEAAARQARVEASRGTGQPQQGGGVLAAFQEAGREFAGPQRNANMGFVRSGPVGYTLVTNRSAGSAASGLDFFVLGQNNAGLRIGPRVEVAAGRERVSGSSTTFARMGLAGELGYNYIASNGVTALVAGGLGGRVSQNESF
jgi:hypothetical protein